MGFLSKETISSQVKQPVNYSTAVPVIIISVFPLADKQPVFVRRVGDWNKFLLLPSDSPILDSSYEQMNPPEYTISDSSFISAFNLASQTPVNDNPQPIRTVHVDPIDFMTLAEANANLNLVQPAPISTTGSVFGGGSAQTAGFSPVFIFIGIGVLLGALQLANNIKNNPKLSGLATVH